MAMRTLFVLLLATGVARGSDSVLLEFSQPGCQACIAMQPAVKQLEREGVAVRHINAARERHLAQRYRVSRFPTFIVLNAGKEFLRLEGARRIEELRFALQGNQGEHIRATGAKSAQPQIPETRMAAVPSINRFASASNATISEPLPSVDLATAIERAKAATVRIRVQEQGAVGVATGTIIDTHGEEALVLTCGHVFRDSKGQTPIEVELFAYGRIHKVPGQLVDYDSEERDIGLVSIKPSFPIPPVPVISSNEIPAAGTAAFSFGCDHGADPTRRDTRVTAINKYNQHIGASNLEIAGAPTIGRSGGGLFDSQGRLIGVCNAADFEDDIGIYAGPGAVMWQLDRVNLGHLYQPRQQTPAAPTRLASNSRDVPFAIGSAPSKGVLAVPQQNTEHSDKEVIVIVRDKNRKGASPQVTTFDTPPEELMKLLGRR